MEKDFWRKKWANNEIAFHENEVNPALTQHINRLSLNKSDRVFIPLCGKTLDISWLLSQGYRVVGVEIIETAIQQLFDEMGLVPTITELNSHKLYQVANLDIFVGDIFDLSQDTIKEIHAVYDRAAFVALPDAMRGRYVEHVAQLTQKAPQLLLTFEYDKSQMNGPPFSQTQDEVKNTYKHLFDLRLLDSYDIEGGLKGLPAQEFIWLLKR